MNLMTCVPKTSPVHELGLFSFLLLATTLLGPIAGLQAADRDWPFYLGNKASTHFSTLKQINRNNVQRLQVTVLDRFIKVRPHVVFLPPSSQGTIVFPGFDGGAEWGGAAIDPRRSILYVNANEMP